jgi:hypothetical protein
MFKPNKYTKIYYSIIENSKIRITSGYIEKHHIIPKSLGGTNKGENIAKLTAREHFICHWLLTKMVNIEHHRSMLYALQIMRKSNKHTQRYDTKITSKVFEKNRIECIKARTGKKATDETRAKLSKARKNRIITDETRKKLSAAALLRGKRGPMSEETKQKIANANKNKTVTNETRRKMSQASSGKPKSQQHKDNMSIAHLHKNKFTKLLD